MSMGFFSHYPQSRGSIHITSRGDVYAPPVFTTGFLSHPADIAPLMWGYKKLREIVRRMVSFRGEVAETHPPFSPESAAVCIDDYDPNIQDIIYSSEDDQVLEHYLRGTVGTTWHSMYSNTLAVD